MAGTIAALADNNRGVAGVAPEARILPLKVFGAPGSQASLSVLAEAFAYAGRLGAPVVNASLGGLGSSTTVTNIIRAYPNTLYVVAAGNDNADAASYYPCNANAANVLCVGASDGKTRGRASPTSAPPRSICSRRAWTSSRRCLAVRRHGRHVDGDAARGGRRRAARGRQAG